jgi:hypothetical protein
MLWIGRAVLASTRSGFGTCSTEAILTSGNGKDSPYSFIKELVEAHDVEKTCPSEHEGFICKGFHTSINGNKLFVAGLPHLSRYNPIGKDKVIEWIKDEAGISVFFMK